MENPCIDPNQNFQVKIRQNFTQKKTLVGFGFSSFGADFSPFSYSFLEN
jgi:hypothetical protein